MATPGKATAKDLFSVIKRSPALMITLGVVAIVVLYVLIHNSKKNAADASATDSSTLPSTNAQGSYYGPSEPMIEPIIIEPLGGGSGPVPAGVAGTSPGIVSPPPPIDTSPQSAGTSGTIPSNNAADDATFGLLGAQPNFNWNPANRTYKNAQGQWVPIPVNPNDPLIQGGQGRVWYDENGKQYLLTSGSGAAVTNSGYPIGSPQNTPGAYTQTNKKTQTAVNR